MSILWRVSGVGEVRGLLGGSAARMRNPRAGLKFVGEEMVLRTHRRLSRGADVNDRPFKPSGRVSRTGGQTLFDRGVLAASVNYEATSTALDLFSADKRARAHYDGLTITPKTAKFLTIPIRARGGLFGGAGLSIKGNRAGYRARDFKGTFFLRRGGKLLLMQRVGPKKSGALRALFLLVRSVKLPKREWLGFGQKDQEMAAEVLGRHITGEQR